MAPAGLAYVPWFLHLHLCPEDAEWFACDRRVHIVDGAMATTT